MRLYLHPQNPEARLVKQLSQRLKDGALVILPTDTVYAFVTLAQNKDSVVKIQQIKDLPKNKALTLYCRDFSQMSTYVRSQGNQLFRLLKEILPGPYTLIFDAAKNLPHYAVTKQNTVGIRIVEHPLIAALLAELDLPLIGSSLDVPLAEMNDFEEIADRFENRVDTVVQCGEVKAEYSTILDVREWPPALIRAGAGTIPSGVG
ncbi:MAG: threonylcarbamoyl-AMP synthase [Spirochaetes bacterium]|nr:threonylcarbamoyl-AMP synthase [Spirochaetota bacterium]